ncbi:MAG TPA: glycosyltransferase family 2 protein [Candidatus Acidoferrales bacterium]|nr:glycosyltransferase family 2 protein [Candidatus Acidoferrales bacterium]
MVVCTRDRPQELDRCLEALARLNYPRFDVLVVDNAPSDTRTREVAARCEARYLLEPVPGLSRARNRGARACESDLVAYLDDDAIPEPDWLSALASEFADPKVMAVTGRVQALNRRTETDRLLAEVAGAEFGGAERLTFDRDTPGWFEQANFGGIGLGMNMAFRRQAFDVWPGFDERLGRGAVLGAAEEHHAFFSLIDRGYRVVYTPHALIRHPAPTSGEELRARHLRSLTFSAGYMTLLFFEARRYRGRTAKYALQAAWGAPRPWRSEAQAVGRQIVPRWRVFLAALPGALLYLRSRFARRLQPGGG